MKLNLATVGCVLLGFATAIPNSNGELDLDARGEKSCSSCNDKHTCGKTYGCHWYPKYECKSNGPGNGKECSKGGRADDEVKCNKHPHCEWICVDESKGECKEYKGY
ncbi:hypothetical protein Forpi1262_v015738 [Fusarium oxysporum f. sp. raphani]|uniref:Antifungal protein n=1 Tax=Fusarium oxysporum f. sp. raphani TaxID=96318 RepID=A0A8J5PRP1_FUSOX|nr:hypothetical protein Forpi1262_v016998 [Fusarium oxysporum f. sp. raphani]KAG7423207.1 hypothetical protein Forpi1262_v015738 [Fusarium oxysporum f. sp. raphani]